MDDAWKIKFNNLDMTKTDFEELVITHHAMFSEISFLWFNRDNKLYW